MQIPSTIQQRKMAMRRRSPQILKAPLQFIVVLAAAAVTAAAGPAPTTPTPTTLEEPELVQRYQATITEEELAHQLHIFAADSLEGRETGTPGQRVAARYLANAYERLRVVGAVEVIALAVFAGAGVVAPDVRDEGERGFSFDPRQPTDDFYLAAGALSSIEGPVSFWGDAVITTGMDYSTFAMLHSGRTTEGASWVLAFAPDGLLEAPGADEPYHSTSTWPELTFSIPVFRDEPLPLGFVFIDSTRSVAEDARKVGQLALSVGRLSLEPRTPVLRAPPVYVVTPEIADSLLHGSGWTVEALRQHASAQRPDVRLTLQDVVWSSHIDFPVRAFETENVAAYIEGSDPALRDEFVVLTAHLDHVGVNPLLPGDTIFNGADDNGSGNVALLEVAEALAIAKDGGDGPRRSVAFLHYSAEEKGLLGSQFYADEDPLFPVDQTVATFNLDMVGRNDPSRKGETDDYVYIIGSRLMSLELHEINMQVNEVTGVRLELDERFNALDDPNRFYRRSDQWNLGKHGVPFIFYFTGTHDDYHGVDDEAHLIDYGKLARVARLAFATSWQVANQDSRLVPTDDLTE